MTRAEEQALKFYPKMSRITEPEGTLIGDGNAEKREGFVQGYEQAEKDIAEHIKLAYGKISMNPFDCSEAFEELLKTIGAV